jgi:hypothetical protein
MVIKNETMVEILAVLNARSIFWFIEMTGYGFLGLATWTAAALFENNGRQKAIKQLCIWNGVISVFGTVLTFIFKGWVLSIPGLICYMAWNILVMVLMTFVFLEYRSRKFSA